MKFFVYRIALTFGMLALVGGCANFKGNSMFGKGNVAQNTPASQTDEAPPPKAAPTEPVVAQPLPVQTISNATAAPAINGQTANGQVMIQSASSAPTAAPNPNASKVKIAILLPLTGKNAPLGHAMLNAAQMAVFDMSSGSFELMPRDTGMTEVSGMAAAHDALSSGAQLLIGPLFAAQVPAVRSVAEPAGISMLTLSTDTSLAAPGVFVMGFAPGAQVSRVINFAATQGLKRYAAIIPDTPYGSLVGQTFRQTVAAIGGTIVDIQTYDLTKHNSAAAVAALSVYRDRIDALFVPAGGDELGRIADQLAAAGFDNHRVRLLGTGLWDEVGVAQHSRFLVGGWYAAPDPAARQNFISVYNHSYGQEPPRLATLAYDATALAAVLARRGEHFDKPSLTNPNGFAGVDGIFRLTEQGLVERGLAVDEIEPATERVVSPAPVTFVGTR